MFPSSPSHPASSSSPTMSRASSVDAHQRAILDHNYTSGQSSGAPSGWGERPSSPPTNNNNIHLAPSPPPSSQQQAWRYEFDPSVTLAVMQRIANQHDSATGPLLATPDLARHGQALAPGTGGSGGMERAYHPYPSLPLHMLDHQQRLQQLQANRLTCPFASSAPSPRRSSSSSSLAPSSSDFVFHRHSSSSASTVAPNVNPFVMRRSAARASVIHMSPSLADNPALASSRGASVGRRDNASPSISTPASSAPAPGRGNPVRSQLAITEYMRRMYSATQHQHQAAESPMSRRNGSSGMEVSAVVTDTLPYFATPAIFSTEGMLMWPDHLASQLHHPPTASPLDGGSGDVASGGRASFSSNPGPLQVSQFSVESGVMDILNDADFSSRYQRTPPRSSDSSDLFAGTSATLSAEPAASTLQTPFHRRRLLRTWSVEENQDQAEISRIRHQLDQLPSAPAVFGGNAASGSSNHAVSDGRSASLQSVSRRREMRREAGISYAPYHHHRRSRYPPTSGTSSSSSSAPVVEDEEEDGDVIMMPMGDRHASVNPHRRLLPHHTSAPPVRLTVPVRITDMSPAFFPANSSSPRDNAPPSPEIERNYIRERLMRAATRPIPRNQSSSQDEVNVGGERIGVDRNLVTRMGHGALGLSYHESQRHMADLNAEQRRRLVYIPQGQGPMRAGFTPASWFHFVDGASAIFMHTDGEPKLILEDDVIAAIGADTESFFFDHQFASTDECIICFEEYEVGQAVRALSCNQTHRFHKVCIDKWLIKNKPNCPICRRILPSLKLPRDHSTPAMPSSSAPPIPPTPSSAASGDHPAVSAGSPPSPTLGVVDLFL